MCPMSNIQQLDVIIMKEWKRIPATICAALVNSMATKIKAMLDDNGGHKNIDTLDTVLTCSLIVYSLFLPAILIIMAVLSYLTRTVYTAIQAAQ